MKLATVAFEYGPMTGSYWWEFVHAKSRVMSAPSEPTLSKAVKSFEKFCQDVDARGPFEFIGSRGEQAHKLLTK